MKVTARTAAQANAAAQIQLIWPKLDRNRAEAKIAAGSMGWLLRRSVTAKAAEDTTASAAAAVALWGPSLRLV